MSFTELTSSVASAATVVLLVSLFISVSTVAATMSFPSKEEVLRTQAQLSNLSKSDRAARATELARQDFQKGNRSVGWYRVRLQNKLQIFCESLTGVIRIMLNLLIMINDDYSCSNINIKKTMFV